MIRRTKESEKEKINLETCDLDKLDVYELNFCECKNLNITKLNNNIKVLNISSSDILFISKT